MYHPPLPQVTQGPGGELQSTEPGRIMAHSYIRLNTMKAITQVGVSPGGRRPCGVRVRRADTGAGCERGCGQR